MSGITKLAESSEDHATAAAWQSLLARIPYARHLGLEIQQGQTGVADGKRLKSVHGKENADQAGDSRLYGGIHIQDANLRGRETGADAGAISKLFSRLYHPVFFALRRHAIAK